MYRTNDKIESKKSQERPRRRRTRRLKATGRKERKRIWKRQGRTVAVCLCGNGLEKPTTAEKKKNNGCLPDSVCLISLFPLFELGRSRDKIITVNLKRVLR